MPQRLVWNLSLDSSTQLDWTHLPRESPDSSRWEARYFWSQDDEICLHGLPDTYLDLSLFNAKHRQDTYYLLPDHPFNIKQRRGEILYKPILETGDIALGYGKKINLYEYPAGQSLPGTDDMDAATLLEAIHQQGQLVAVSKYALLHKFDTEPGIKLELARLNVAGRIFFSVCVEGRSQNLVRMVAERLLKQQTSCDYVTFLKQMTLP